MTFYLWPWDVLSVLLHSLKYKPKSLFPEDSPLFPKMPPVQLDSIFKKAPLLPNGINVALSLRRKAEPSDLRVSPFIVLLSSRFALRGENQHHGDLPLKSLKSCSPAWNRRGLASVTLKQLLSSRQACHFQPS